MVLKLIYLLLSVSLISCGGQTRQQTEIENHQTIKEMSSSAPFLDADSAYTYIRQQVDFGPRVPNTDAHKACADYLIAALSRTGAKVIKQEATLSAFDNTALEAINIIGTFNPDNSRRILLFAHWDSRPFADEDPDKNKQQKPILGADDGGSGVGVLLEIARQIGKSNPGIGIDIIFFDAEDYGTPDFYTGPHDENSWCLGAQYWAKHPHTPNYKADFGILLDMVGSKDAVFYKERTSLRYAPVVVEKVWNTARNLGYGKYFINAKGGMITDDHQYVIEERNIPCIDIINFDPDTDTGFGSYWHTHKDNMDIIDRETLKAVGQTVLEVIYNHGSK